MENSIGNRIGSEPFVPKRDKPQDFKTWRDYALYLRHEIDMQQVAIDSLNAHLKILVSEDRYRKKIS